jgi:hypothetical protein
MREPFVADPYALDANAVAGDLHELFGHEMTVATHACASCGNHGAIGTLRAWVGGPGVVLRCSVCGDVVLRWTRTPHGVRVDLRGAAFINLPGM